MGFCVERHTNLRVLQLQLHKIRNGAIFGSMITACEDGAKISGISHSILVGR